MLRLGRPDPRDHGQGRYLQQRNDVVAATDARIERFEQPHQAHGGTERQHDAQGQDQDAVRSDGLLRLYRRLDQREAVALAFGFQVFTELRFHLFLLHFGMLFLSALEVAHQRAVVALNHGCGGAALLELGQTRAKLCLLCGQRCAFAPGLLAAGLDLNIGRIVRLLTSHGRGRRARRILELIFEQRDLSCETHHIRVVIGVYLARLGQIGACLLQFSLGIAITVLTAKLPLESRDLTLEPLAPPIQRLVASAMAHQRAPWDLSRPLDLLVAITAYGGLEELIAALDAALSVRLDDALSEAIVWPCL